MLVTLDKFGGVAPKIIDPLLLPPNRSQIAKNVRFDRGGLAPIGTDSVVQASPKPSALALFVYDYLGVKYFFTWDTDVDVVKAPLPNDSYSRVFYTEAGIFKVTDKNLFNQGGTNYPMVSRLPSPPAPTDVPVATGTTPSGVTGLTVSSSACVEADGTYALIFSGGGGSGATGTYTILGNVIMGVALTAGGSLYTATPIVTTQSGNGSIIASIGGDPTFIETRGYVYTFVNSYGEEGPPSLVSNLVAVLDGTEVDLSGMSSGAGISADYNLVSKRIYRLNQSVSGAQYQFVAEIALATTTYADLILDSDLGEVLATTEWDGPPAGIKGIIALPNGILAGYVGNLVCFSVPYYPHAWPASYQKATDWPIVALGAFGTNVVVLTQGQPYVVVGNDPSNMVMERVELGLSCTSKRGALDVGDIIVYPTPQGIAAIGSGVNDLLTKDLIIPEDWMRLFNPSTISAYYWQGKYVGFYTLADGIQAGFLFDPKTADLIDLDFYATAGYHDKTTGTLYLIVAGNIVSFAGASGYREVDYLSKKFKFAMSCLGCAKVLSTSYPVTLDVIYRKIPFAVALTVPSDEPVRLPTYLVDECEVRIYGDAEVSAVLLASTMQELPV